MKELQQHLDLGTWSPTNEHIKNIKPITSKLFIKDKYDAHGNFIKTKARLVAGGHLQDKTIYDDISSPTASCTSLYMIAAIAARYDMHVSTGDITGAYLKAFMPDDTYIYMYLDPIVSAITITVDPSYANYLREDGKILVKLIRALYGCVQSGKLWNDKITNDLIENGFCKHPLEECLFTKSLNNDKIFVLIYVDDLFIVSDNLTLMDDVQNMFQKLYGKITFNTEKIHNFIGHTLDFSNKSSVKISMISYLQDILNDNNIIKTVTTPATNSLFQADNINVPNNTYNNQQQIIDINNTVFDKIKFHRTVAQLLYLAKRTRPDILLSINYLCTKVQHPVAEDNLKLKRILEYLNGTRELGITLEIKNKIEVSGWIDASYGIHSDRKSHSGVVISLGRGPIFVKSSKQKIIAKSSTEAELIAISDGASQVIWCKDFINYLGYNVKTATIYQDNTSTISLVKKGSASSDRTRHIDVRYFWIKERVLAKEIEIKHVSTIHMLADILTKPLQGNQFKQARNDLLNSSI
jgi:histone deacetylase 1/2